MIHMSKEELEQHMEDQLTKLVEYAGGPHYLAKCLAINVSNVKGWIQRKRISKDGAKLVAKNQFLNREFKAKELRPDLDI